MKLPVVTGLIERRMLVNFRLEPALATKLLPAPFRPKLVGGYAMAGICLIRLTHLRPTFVPASLGIGSENVAHRIAVEWDQDGVTHSGVYIPRRDSSSVFNYLAGGRLFPGVHHRANFRVEEEDADYFHIQVISKDNQTEIEVEASVAEDLPVSSIFESMSQASDFFKQGGAGYSPSRSGRRLEGLELCSYHWKIEPLKVSKVTTSYFDNAALFPPGSIKFDCALLMRNIKHEWHACEPPVASTTIPI